jgi:hypothetical protein
VTRRAGSPSPPVLLCCGRARETELPPRVNLG